MDTKIEISPNSRASCLKCKKIINKGEVRLKISGDFCGHTNYRYNCEKCAKENLLEELDKTMNKLNKIKHIKSLKELNLL